MAKRQRILVLISVLVGSLLLAGLAIAIGSWANQQNEMSTQGKSQASAVPPAVVALTKPSAVPTGTATPPEFVLQLPPPLANVDFPSNSIDYSTGWPEDCRFPLSFVLLEANSARLLNATTPFCSMKHRFTGDPQSAATTLSEFLSKRGWQVLEKQESGRGDIVVLYQRGEGAKKGQADIVFDTDPQVVGMTRVLSFIFP